MSGILADILFSAFSGVVILWVSMWAAISKGKVAVFLPLALAGFFFIFYAGSIIDNSSLFSMPLLQDLFIIPDIMILAALAWRKQWKR